MLGLHDFAHEATHEFLHLDGKILKTLKLLLFKPGQLTKEFIEGRRARYISPLRIYLTFSVLFFFLMAVTPANREAIKFDFGSSAESKEIEGKVREALMHNLPRAAFVLMPAFALLTWLFYRREQPYYVPHLYYAIHFHAFVFFALALIILLGLLGMFGRVLGGFTFLWLFPYHYVALRRVFGGSRAVTFAKGTTVGVLYWTLLALAMLATTWITLKTL